MGQSYDRRINLYINVDGKQVANDVKSIRGELQKIINEQNRMTIGSEEYNKQTAKIKQLNGILAQHRAGLKEIESPMQKLIGTAKGLLPAFGFAALGGLAQKAFGQIIAATDTLGTKWDIFLGGVRGGLTELWRTIASGNWSNFITNMSEAVRVGREYQSMLDTIEEKSRALRMVEANANREALELEVQLRNVGLTDEERLAAGQARIKLEQELSKQRLKIAQDEFDSEMMLAEQQTRLSKERILEVIADIDSEKKAQASKYNKILALHKSAIKKSQAANAGLARAGVSENPFAKEVEETKAQLDSFPDSVKVYAEAIRGMGITTDEQLNKVVASYEKLKSAENSSLENVKRVTTQVNSLLAGEKDEPSGSSQKGYAKGKINKDTEDADAAKKLEEFISKDAATQIAAIKQQFKEAGETAFDDFMNSIEANQRKKTVDFSNVPETAPEEEQQDPDLDYAIRKYQDTLEYKKTLLETQRKNGLIGEEEYQDRLTEINKQAEQERMQTRMQFLQQTEQLVQMGGNFVTALMEYELEKAGENEEKKKKIRKNMQMPILP